MNSLNAISIGDPSQELNSKLSSQWECQKKHQLIPETLRKFNLGMPSATPLEQTIICKRVMFAMLQAFGFVDHTHVREGLRFKIWRHGVQRREGWSSLSDEQRLAAGCRVITGSADHSRSVKLRTQRTAAAKMIRSMKVHSQCRETLAD